MIKPINKNTLFYGDNLDILREYIPDESVDLIYLDPPFNSNRSYNVLFKDESGKDSQSQITAFEDTWHWGEDAQRTYHELLQHGPAAVSTMISALRQFIGANQMMAYLVMMTARLIELHRVLKSTGSIYLHCDPTASHYLKVVLDTIFGVQNFRNEISWIRTSAHANVIQKYGAIHDIIFYYTRSDDFTWNQLHIPYEKEYLETFFDQLDADGRRYARRDLTASMQRASSGQIYTWRGITPPPSRCWAMTKERMDELYNQGRIHFPKKEGGMPRLKLYPEDLPGVPVQDVWNDIKPIHNLGAERLGYPTQKPLALLERIIQVSSNEGDVVLDPFCGCGTAVVASQKLNRRWIGIDVTHLAIALMKYRLKDSFNLVDKKDYEVIGEPESLGDAVQLAKDDRYQFQWWAASLVQAKPLGGEGGSRGGKKGSDRGIDGIIHFVDDKDKTEQVLVQVKSGHVSSRDVRDLRGTVEREGAAIGVFITLEPPSRDMITEAVTAGAYRSKLWQQEYPRLQIMTVEDLLRQARVLMPPTDHTQTFRQAERIKKKEGTQGEFDF